MTLIKCCECGKEKNNKGMNTYFSKQKNDYLPNNRIYGIMYISRELE